MTNIFSGFKQVLFKQELNSVFRRAIYLGIYIIGFIAFTDSVGANSVISSHKFDDWIILPECSQLGNKSCSNRCKGYYLEPEYKYLLSTKPEDFPLEITSDEGKFEDKGTSVFTGHVISKQGNRTIISDKANIIQNKETGELETIHAIGNVTITEPDVRIDGDKAHYFSIDDTKTVDNATFRTYSRHTRGTSCKLQTKGANLMYLPKGTFTSCEPNSNTWQMKATKINLDKESGRGEAFHAKLYLHDIPVFYWPYVSFPIDSRRKTGFLFPDFKYSSNFGATIKAPFYWNIAPNYDATITPSYSENRGVRFLNEFRYLTDKSSGTILFDYLPNDDKYRSFRAEKLKNNPAIDQRILALKDNSQRFAFSLKHKTDFTKDLSLDIDYTKIGDDNFLQQIGPDILQVKHSLVSPTSAVNSMYANTNTSNISASTTAILQKLQLQHKGTYGTVNYTLQQYQTLHPFSGASSSEQYRKLPEINLQTATFDLPGDFGTSANAIYTHFKIRPNGTDERNTYGKRFYIKPVLSRHIIEPGWFVKPNIKIHHVNYDLKLKSSLIKTGVPKRPKKTIPIYDLDTGLIFERETKFKKTAYIQTLEPRAYFLYVPNKTQTTLPNFDTGASVFNYDQLFRDNRYSGFDRQSEAKQIALGLTTRFLTDADNAEKASFSVGQLYYFQDRVEHLAVENFSTENKFRVSPIAAQLKYKMYTNWNLEGNLVWNKRDKTIDLASVALQYLPSQYNVVNLGYTFTRNEAIDNVTGRKNHVKQLHLSSAWFINHHIRTIGKIEYNLNRKNIINLMGGIEYYGCCVNLRAVVTNYLTASRTLLTPRKRDSTIGFQIIFKGFADTGSTDASAITSAIPGYSAPEDDGF